MKKPQDKSEVVTFRLPLDIAAKARALAQEKEWTLSFTLGRLVRKALEPPAAPKKSPKPKKTRAA